MLHKNNSIANKNVVLCHDVFTTTLIFGAYTSYVVPLLDHMIKFELVSTNMGLAVKGLNAISLFKPVDIENKNSTTEEGTA
jgi:hypothetical protein